MPFPAGARQFVCYGGGAFVSIRLFLKAGRLRAFLSKLLSYSILGLNSHIQSLKALHLQCGFSRGGMVPVAVPFPFGICIVLLKGA